MRRNPRRAKLATLLFVELCTQWVHICAFIAPNIYELARPCDFFASFIGAHSLTALLTHVFVLHWPTIYNTSFLLAASAAEHARTCCSKARLRCMLFVGCSLLRDGALELLECHLRGHLHPGARVAALLAGG
jgi:hypothetical protein